MSSSNKADRRAAFMKLASEVSPPDVSVLAGSMVKPSGTAVTVARRLVGGASGRGVTCEVRVNRLAVKLDRLVTADRQATVKPKRAHGGR